MENIQTERERGSNAGFHLGHHPVASRPETGSISGQLRRGSDHLQPPAPKARQRTTASHEYRRIPCPARRRLGQEEAPPPRSSVGSRLSKRTLAGTFGNGWEAPKALVGWMRSPTGLSSI